ncbi:UPF0721 transmembrane protein [Nitratireductor aestuarii]|uniref:Probable membrane transporter protein n=1 Tax=Nitratireductor aestuarii TaxID=1735103 RepID=A0A916S191_9HYPH|nr:sulfite exporter TauE/SafE family protein [Nitratireductor aestuarii]GGA76611.1 UPF0721 transmembrane protein [Nitratireductor aestuarii]
MHDLLVLGVAAFAAGVLNTIAGGGTFLTFPALVFTGVPVVSANATSTVAVFPGYLGGALGFRREIAELENPFLVKVILATMVGGLAGSLLLLVSSNDAFSVVVPFLLAAATLAFAFGDRIRTWAEARKMNAAESIGTTLASVYGGYFNGGLGIILLALFSLWGMRDLHQMNGLKTLLSFVLSAISVVTFAVAGIVEWPQALLMMVAATAGGYAGAPLARILPRAAVRATVIVVGAGMSALFFLRLFA